MGVDTHVSSGTTQTLPLPVRNVLLAENSAKESRQLDPFSFSEESVLRFGIPVLLGHSKVDDVDDVFSLRAGPSDQEVVGLDVTVDEVLLVNRLNPCNLSDIRTDKGETLYRMRFRMIE